MTPLRDDLVFSVLAGKQDLLGGARVRQRGHNHALASASTAEPPRVGRPAGGTTEPLQAYCGRSELYFASFASFAYVLMQGIRRLGARSTELARAQCRTLRLKLLKVGARVRITARRVWLSFSESWPHAETFAEVLENLRAQPARNPPG